MRIWTSTQSRRRGVLALLACITAGFLVAGCGSKDFPNDPRPPRTLELTALINNDKVIVDDPKPNGAGPVTITISNQSSNPAKLVLIKGDGSRSKAITSPEITPDGGTGRIQTNLDEGTYTASVGDSVGIKTDKLDIGPARKSAQNDLLLP